jgi:hypothetical protein
MFSSLYLGNLYTPTAVPTKHFSIKPLKQPSGAIQYFALNSSVPGITIDRVDTVLKDTKDKNETEKKEEDTLSLGGDHIKAFYIGSATVVGLYILFRIITKTR